MFVVQPSAAEHWLAAAVPGRLVVVEVGQPSAEALRDLRDVVQRSSGAQDVLAWLTRAGLLATPAFVLVESIGGDGARFIVRGTARPTVTTASGDRMLDASGVSTWLEQVIHDANAFEVAFPQAEGAANSTAVAARTVLLDAGAAWVSRVQGDLTVSVPDGVARAEEPIVGREAPTQTLGPEPTSAQTTAPEVTIAAPLETVAGTPAESDSDRGEPEAESIDDHAFGATVVRRVDDTAADPVEPETVGSAADAGGQDLPNMNAAEPDAADADLSELGDHDGLTVFSGDISGWRERHAGGSDPASPATQVLPASERFVLAIAGGTREPLSGPVLVGRAPSVSQVSGGSVPRLLTVGGADQDISRNHVQFTVEGDTVVVTDLHSRNGTLVVLPGKAPQKLRAGEPTSVIAGTVVDLGGGVTMTVEQE